VGDCAFSHIALKDRNKTPLGDMIKDHLGKENCKVLSMHGMGQRAFYNIIKALLNRGEYPKLSVLETVPEVLTSKAHIMPRTQHSGLFSKLLSVISNPSSELAEYEQLTRERFERFQVETYAHYSETDNGNVAKLYMKMNYMFTLNDKSENVIYLIKNIQLLNGIGIPVILYIPPVNYIQGEIYWGKEFTEKYKKIFDDLWSILKGLKYSVLDSGFLLEHDSFADFNTIDETANIKGRLKLMDFFIESGVFQQAGK
jgi:hypothetical protein